MQDSQSNFPIVIEFDDIQSTRLKLIKIVAWLINKKYTTQKKAASALNIDQPKVSQIHREKTEGFSLEYLINLLIALDQEVNVQIKRPV